MTARAAIRALCVAVIVAAAAHALYFDLETYPHHPAYAQRMAIDSQTYIREANGMIARGDVLSTPDTFHSVGMQGFTAAVFRVFGPDPLAVKVVLWVIWLAVLALAWVAYRRAWPGSLAPWVATALLASSVPLARYTGIVQHEMLGAAGLAALLAIHVVPRRARWCWASGAIVALLAMIRIHYALLLIPVVVAAGARAARLAAIAGFVLLALPWNVFHSVKRGAPFLFQSALPGQATRWLTPAARGDTFPYPEPVPPTGLAFIAERPLDYLRLLGRKLTYLTGIEPDIWYVEPLPATALAKVIARDTARRVVAWLMALVTLGGVTLLAARRARTRAGLLAAGLVAALLVPHLVVGSSTRFLVPAIPLLVLLQVSLFTRKSRMAAASSPG